MAVTLGLALCGPAVAAQTRDVRPGAGMGVISGIVVSDDAEARPVRKARVTCSRPDAPGDTTVTDDAGRFIFAGLPAGRYNVGAAKATWIAVNHGAARSGRPGSPVPLAAGQKLEVVLRMARGAVITGVVLDHNNEPAAARPVRALRSAIVNGERRLVATAAAMTDDRGVYRLFGLPSGDYIVSTVGAGPAGPELRLTSDADIRHASAPVRTPPPAARGVTIAATYYPGTTMVSQASPITIGKGEERDGIDLTLQLAPTARVEGAVSMPEGGVPRGTEVHLIANDDPGGPAMPLQALNTRSVDAGGAFSFGNIGPGLYTVAARAARPATNPDGSSAGPPQMVWASIDIAVDGEDVRGLSLSLEPGLTISGRVRFEGTSLKPPADMKSIRVTASPAELRSSLALAPAPVSIGADGRFTLPGVTPGRYRLTASFPGSGRPGGWLMRSAIAAGQDSLDAPFTLSPNQHVLDAVITFTDRMAQLTGSVLDASGAAAPDCTVIVFPADPALWIAQSRRIQGIRPGADGAYAVRGIPAGRYLVAAIDDVEPGEWFDRAFLQRLASSAATVAIADGEQSVRDLRIAGGR
ncbi:MAG TPA: carboxypeptidase-like regulatory domain-containing protein [Vicinamibacterales bacterium]|nr:carboxypeptidase-like regulatory domain-containing protein [Vicinamibacterales bacterium]